MFAALPSSLRTRTCSPSTLSSGRTRSSSTWYVTRLRTALQAFRRMLMAVIWLSQHSFFYMTKAAVPHLQKVKGSIVNNASVRLANSASQPPSLD